MMHDITVHSGTTTDTLTATGGIFIVAYDTPTDGNSGVTAIIRAHPQDLAKAMLGNDGMNSAAIRQFSKQLCDALYGILRKTGGSKP
jgi:hypothetical protein